VDPDAAKAGAAMREMIAHPAAAVGALRERLRPASPADQAVLDKLIAQLGAPKFADRAQAVNQLVALGDLALPRLREAARSRDAEAARRAREAIDRLETVERWRIERAVEVLEHTGNAEALNLLRELARGKSDAWLTIDASAAADRVAALGK
jgi:hypothetical protein